MSWTATLYSADGGTRIGKIRVPGGPVCGQDFCDGCGDCLVCDFCACQQWIVYEDNLSVFMEEHDGARLEPA